MRTIPLFLKAAILVIKPETSSSSYFCFSLIEDWFLATVDCGIAPLILRQYVLQLLSKSIEQLRQPSAHLQESEEEQEEQHREEVEGMQEDRLPPGGVIRKHTLSSSSSGSSSELPDTHYGVIKVKEEPADSEDEALTNQSLESEQSTYLHQVKGRLVIRAMIWEGKRMRSHTCNIRK